MWRRCALVAHSFRQTTSMMIATRHSIVVDCGKCPWFHFRLVSLLLLSFTNTKICLYRLVAPICSSQHAFRFRCRADSHTKSYMFFFFFVSAVRRLFFLLLDTISPTIKFANRYPLIFKLRVFGVCVCMHVAAWYGWNKMHFIITHTRNDDNEDGVASIGAIQWNTSHRMKIGEKEREKERE